MAIAGLLVGLLGVSFAGFTLWRSGRWHREDSSAAAEALQVAKAAAEAQARLAGRDPWSVVRIGDTSGVRLTNETGAAAIDVELSLTGHWVFWDNVANDPAKLGQQQTITEGRIERGSSIRHQISLISAPLARIPGWLPPDGVLRVTWSDESGKRERWTWPVLSIFEDGGPTRLG